MIVNPDKMPTKCQNSSQAWQVKMPTQLKEGHWLYDSEKIQIDFSWKHPVWILRGSVKQWQNLLKKQAHKIHSSWCQSNCNWRWKVLWVFERGDKTINNWGTYGISSVIGISIRHPHSFVHKIPTHRYNTTWNKVLQAKRVCNMLDLWLSPLSLLISQQVCTRSK